MKVKLSLSGDGIKQFLVAHCEKIGLSLIMLVCAWLAFSGYQREVTPTTPDHIRELNQRAQSHIQNTTWDAVAKDRVKEINFEQRATNVLQELQTAPYEIGPFIALTSKPQTKRIDPQLYPVEALEIAAGFEPIAIRQRRATRERRGIIGNPRNDEDEELIFLRSLTGKERENFEGQQKKGRGGMRGGRMRSGNADKAEAWPFVSILGIVPIRRQMDEYNRCFKDADGYLPQRDTPTYSYHYIRRREIAPDGTPGDWKSDINSKKAVAIANKWQSPAPPIADRDYLYEKSMGTIGMGDGGRSQWGRTWPGLHWPLPPLLLCDITPFALHSKVPAMQVDYGQMGQGMLEEEFDPNEISDDAPTGGPGMRRPGMMERGPISGGDARSGMFGLGGTVAQYADHVLLRIFDFQVSPGKTYQYQVQLVLEDANNPSNVAIAPPEQTLDLQVVDRRRSLKDKKPAEKYFRSTEWSEISDAVTVPNGREVLAGAPELLRTVTLSQGTYDKRAPRINVMALAWHKGKKVEVFQPKSVTRGSAVNLKGIKFLAIDPAESSVNELTVDYNLRTDMFVVDLRGGRRLPGRESELLETSEMLLLDSNGRMSFHSETDDFPRINNYDIDVTKARKNRDSRGLGGRPGERMDDFGTDRQPTRGRNRNSNPGRRRGRG